MCVRFPRLRPGGTTVHSVLPPLFRLSFRVHLVSIFRFRAFAAHSCYGTISFRVSVYFPFGWSSRPVGGPVRVFRDNIRLFLRVGLCMSVMQNTTWTFVGSGSGQLVTYHHIFRLYGGETLKGFYHTSSSSLFVLIYLFHLL